MALNVETYQLGKKHAGDGSSIAQDVNRRLEALEKNQMTIINEFDEKFINDTYIDNVKTTAIITSYGVIGRQFTNTLKEDFENDLKIDWDTSTDVSLIGGKVKLRVINAYIGLLVTDFYDTPGTKSFTMGANQYLPTEIGFGGMVEAAEPLNSWFMSGVDNFERLWVFDKDTRTGLNTPSIYLTIYNKDMTVYKTRKLTDIVLPPSAANFITLGGEIIFDYQNICLLSFNSTDQNIMTKPISSNAAEATGEFVVSCNESGIMIDIIYNLVYMTYYNTSYYAFNPAVPPICKFYGDNNLLITKSKSCAGYYHNGSASIRLTDGYCLLKYDNGKNLKTIYTDQQYNVKRHGIEVNLANHKCHVPYKPFFIYKGNDIYSIFPQDLWSTSNNLRSNSALYFKKFTINNTVPDSSVDLAVGTFAAASGTLIYLQGDYGGRLSGVHYNESNESFYVFTPTTHLKAPLIDIRKYKLDMNTMGYKVESYKRVTLNRPTSSPYNMWAHDVRMQVVDDGKLLHIFYLCVDDSYLCNSLRYMCMDYDMNIKVEDSLVYCGFEEGKDVYFFRAHLHNGRVAVAFNNTSCDGVNTVSDGVKIAFIETKTSSNIEYYYSTEKELAWQRIGLGELVTKAEAFNKIRFKAVLSTTGNLSPELDSITVQYYDSLPSVTRKSELVTKRIPTVINNGKAVLSADYDLGDGLINWFVSFDGGVNFTQVNLDEEFVYNYATSPDFRIKADIYVSDSSSNVPKIRSYNLRTNNIALHSDIEELQINLMKTNFKIDTFMNASKNGLHKMGIEVFSNADFIDIVNSDCLWGAVHGEVYGNYAVTFSEHIDGPIKTLLITSDEDLGTEPNSRIEYFVSTDDGVTFVPIIPNIKQDVTTANTADTKLKFKFVFHGSAGISAIGWAWD